MALNPQYEEIGKTFVSQYYALFDDPLQRPNLIHLFNVSIALKMHFFPLFGGEIPFWHMILQQKLPRKK